MSAIATAPAADQVVFDSLGLPEALLRTLHDRDYQHPTPIQAALIPHLLAGSDVIGQAQTGTGKTAAFALPLLSRLETDLRHPQVLVLAPTRELAKQVAEACQSYGERLPDLRVATVYGGAGYHEQLRDLRAGAQLVVGTPGRVMDHVERGSLDLSRLRCLVLDEADEMLRMGFIDDVQWILDRLPEERQVALLSATMPKPIRIIAQRYLRDPVEIAIQTETATVDTIDQHYWFARGLPKYEALARILEAENTDGVLVFTRTKAATVEVAEGLERHGIKVAALNGDMAQGMRERCVEHLRDGRLDVVVATDVAARGLDVDRISHVINYDMPPDAETYVHRIGRTGRAGRSGKAILFVHPREKRDLQNIERRTRQRIPEMRLPDLRGINAVRRQRFAARLLTATATVPQEFQDLVDDLIENGMDPAKLAAAAAHLLNGSASLELPDTEQRPRKQFSMPQNDGERTPYRLAVGSRHGTKPGMIVGAIANELGIPGGAIGAIRIFDNHSTVSLPCDLPPRMRQSLLKIRVAGRPLGAVPL
ncbi:MAG: DEAD/DEAH box helicase [Planctomycetota bacterium]